MGLNNGAPVQIFASIVDERGRSSPHVSSGVVVPGCVPSPRHAQCCGHGVCGLKDEPRATRSIHRSGSSSGSSAAKCFCEEAFHGQFCERRNGRHLSTSLEDCEEFLVAVNGSYNGYGTGQEQASQEGTAEEFCRAVGPCVVVMRFGLLLRALGPLLNSYNAAVTSLLLADVHTALKAASASVPRVQLDDISAKLEREDADGFIVIAAVSIITTTAKGAEILAQEMLRQLQSTTSALRTGIISSWIDTAGPVSASFQPVASGKALRAGGLESGAINSGFSAFLLLGCAVAATAMLVHLARGLAATRCGLGMG
jgi:hypothetical protein